MIEQSTKHPAQPAGLARLVSLWLAPVALAAAVALLAAVVARSSVDLDAVRQAARQGVLDAYAELGLGAPTPAGSPVEVNAPATRLQPQSVDLHIRAANRLGDPNAPVTIVEFSDFRCPYCGKFFRETAPALIREYVEMGKAQLVYKHFAILGPESVRAAQAAECAADQGRFWAYHDALFGRESFDDSSLIALASDLKLDPARFGTCLKNDETLARVEADEQEALQVSARGTPAFFINGYPLFGAQPIETFRAALNALLP